MKLRNSHSLSSLVNRILLRLEPSDVYDQALLPSRARSLRMRLSDTFYTLCKGLDN